MSDEEQIETEVEESTTRMLTAEYKDGKLQIVEVSPYHKGTKVIDQAQEIEAQESESEDGQYMQVLDGDKNVVLDLLNLTLVRCGDGEQSYRLVGNNDETVTCVLAEDDGQNDQESYVVVEGGSDQGPLVFLQSDLRTEAKQQKPVMSPTEILERAKALQKAKSVLSHSGASRGRSSLPPPHELLSSPAFKLFLYSCKLCSFKCNAIKELTKHKASEHSGGVGKWRGRAAASSLQCARCPYRANTHSQLIRHVKDRHLDSGSEY
nr:uncharacterized protein LOC116776153 [Danaus plexippus plexippus]